MSNLAINGGAPLRQKPFPAWPEVTADDEAAVGAVVRSGKWWMYAFHQGELAGADGEGGSRVEQFEREWAAYQGTKFALTTASGSGALEIVCRALDLQPGDEVITTPYTFIASSSCLLNAGALPVYVDIDSETYTLDASKVEAAITPRTRAILVVHFGGNIADMTRLCAIAQKHRLLLIEDAAQAHGAMLRGNRSAGGMGHAGIFSFQESKLLTSGEGGAITTNDAAISEKCWSLRHYGRHREGEWYKHFDLGWQYRLTELQGALLLQQLKKFPSQQSRRECNVRAFFNKLEGIPGIRPCALNPETERSARYLIILRFDSEAWDGVPRETLLEALRAEGVPCLSGYTFPMYENPLFQSIDFTSPSSRYRSKGASAVDFHSYRGTCPVAERACERESIWLTHQLFLGSEHDAGDIARAFWKVYEQRHSLRKALQPC